MIVGDFTTFAVFYEVLEEVPYDKKQRYGLFNIAVNKNFLIPWGTTNFTVGIILPYLAMDLQKEADDVDRPEMDCVALFRLMTESRGLSLFDDELRFGSFGLPDPEGENNYENYLKAKEASKTNPPIGREIPLFGEIDDEVLLSMYLLKGENYERLIFSPDQGETVQEAIFELGTVNNVLSKLEMF